MGWQPIETTPENEGALLVAYSDGTSGMAYREQSWKGRWRWVNLVFVRGGGLVMGSAGEVTHWMPLPDPPNPLAE